MWLQVMPRDAMRSCGGRAARTHDKKDRKGHRGLSGEPTMEHVHLHVAHLPEAEPFYVGLPRFQVVRR